jgi:hypothetical protein
MPVGDAPHLPLYPPLSITNRGACILLAQSRTPLLDYPCALSLVAPRGRNPSYAHAVESIRKM